MIDDEVSINFHRQAHTLVVPIPEPLSDTVVSVLERDILPVLKNQALTSIVFDFGAVDSIDTHSLKRCQQLFDGARLLGAQVALAAFRPHVAATCVELGDCFEDVLVARSVHTAIKRLSKDTA